MATGSKGQLPPEWQVVDVARLVKAPWNYKHDEPDAAARLVESVRRSGQIQVLNVREVGDKKPPMLEVYDGNHRVDAVGVLGLEQVIVHNAGRISQAEAARRAMELNENGFEADMIRVAELFRDDLLPEFDLPDLAGSLPWDESQITDLVSSLDFDLSALLTPSTEPPPTKSGNKTPDGMTKLSLAKRTELVSDQDAERFWACWDALVVLSTGGSPVQAILRGVQLGTEEEGGNE